MMERWTEWRSLFLALRGSECSKVGDAVTFLLLMTLFPEPQRNSGKAWSFGVLLVTV